MDSGSVRCNRPTLVYVLVGKALYNSLVLCEPDLYDALGRLALLLESITQMEKQCRI
jgi:hypothetical protein